MMSHKLIDRKQNNNGVEDNWLRDRSRQLTGGDLVGRGGQGHLNHDPISQACEGTLARGPMAQSRAQVGAWKSRRPWQLTWLHSPGENFVAPLKGCPGLQDGEGGTHRAEAATPLAQPQRTTVP